MAAPAYDYSSIAANWKNLSGLNNWEGLLDPLNLDLRRYILHYTDMALAIQDALIRDEQSPHVWECRYTKEALLDRVGLIKGRNGITMYDVTKLVYVSAEGALAIINGTSFGGYVAVASDTAKKVLGRRDILVAWRGMITLSEKIADIDAILVQDENLFPRDPASWDDVVPRVHQGFHNAYTVALPENRNGAISARDQVLSEIKRLVELYKDEELSITIAGHSMGSALGTLNAVDIVANGYNKPAGTDKIIPVTAIVSGTPRVGELNFKEYLDAKPDLHILRVVNNHDIVPNLPPRLPYLHVGVELKVDSGKSHYLRNGASTHYDQAYLHAVVGWQGPNSDFNLTLDRDLALLNKNEAVLKEDIQADMRIKEKWWSVANQGMVLRDDGTWRLDDDVPEGL